MSKYCVKCGHKQELNSANFCSSCGEPLSSIAKKNNMSPKRSVTLSEDETDASSVPHIEKFEVSVEMPSNVVKISNKNGQLVFESSQFEKRNVEL